MYIVPDETRLVQEARVLVSVEMGTWWFLHLCGSKEDELGCGCMDLEVLTNF